MKITKSEKTIYNINSINKHAIILKIHEKLYNVRLIIYLLKFIIFYKI